MKVIITGASGVLGRAATKHFHAKGDTVIPLSFSRTNSPAGLPAYQKLDLLDFDATRAFFRDEEKKGHVDVILHCAAERRPDVAERDPARAERLNKDAVAVIVELAEEIGCLMVYVSTDYVFDGKTPPYKPDDKPNPLNLYGKLKEAGEQAVLASRRGSKHVDEVGKGAIVLRVPLLYGEVEFNAETAVNIFVDVIEDQSGKTYKMDHFAVRFPTCVEDVSRVMYDLSHHTKALPAITHFSAQNPYTKYEMTRLIAQYLGLPIEHVVPDTTDPATLPNQTVLRPGNTQLSVDELDALGISAGEEKGFETWWREWAQRHKA